MNQNNNVEYYTKDIGEAAAMLTMGRNVVRLEPGEANFWFVFSEKQECENISNLYWSGELTVSAKMYSTNLRLLKDRLFARR